MLHTTQYEYKLHCNAKPTNWRERVGRWLREVAELLDGRRTLALELDSRPTLTVEVQTQCITLGLDHMTRCFKNAVADEAREKLFREAMPHVFDA